MAEALYRKAAIKAGRLDEVISRGTMTDPETARTLGDDWPSSIVMMQYYGLDISQHVPKAVGAGDIAWADLILTMTKHHVGELRQKFSDRPDLHLDRKLHTFGNYLGLSVSGVDDPIGKTYDVYHQNAKQFESWTKLLVEKLNSHNTKSHGQP